MATTPQFKCTSERRSEGYVMKMIRKYWLQAGRKSGFGIGFDITFRFKMWNIDLGFWWIGGEWK